MEENHEENLKDLYERVLEDKTPKFNLEYSLEIADLTNISKPNCKLSVSLLRKYLGSLKTDIVYKAVLVFEFIQLLEYLVKNCAMRFHYEISSKEFMDTLQNLLKRVLLYEKEAKEVFRNARKVLLH